MRCHYEVLGVNQNATNDELKKAYRKMALQWHPDKNPDQLDEAKKQFQYVQAAYETLTDPQERAFYDRNRDSFLRNHGADGSSGKSSQGIDLYGFLSSQCYSGFNDSEKGFYTVYRQLFEKIAVSDIRYMDEEDDIIIPNFGRSDMDLEEVARFYTYWSGYCTSMAFEWADEFDIREAHQMGRWVEKKIEKENNKARQKARKQFNEEVRALVAFVRKRDKRWQERKKMQAAKAEEKVKKQKEIQDRDKQERIKQMAEHIEKEKTNMAAYEDQLREMEARMAAEWGITESEESDFEEELVVGGDTGDGTAEADGEADDIASLLMDDLYCVACNKTFRTERSMECHEKTRKHRENIEALKATMRAENKEMEEEHPVNESTSRLHESGSADDETTATLPKPSKKKKKKKSSRQNTAEDATSSLSSSSKSGRSKKKRQELYFDDSSDSPCETEKLVTIDNPVTNGHNNVEDNSQSKDSAGDIQEQEDQAEVTAKPKKGKKAKEERRRAREGMATANSIPEINELRCTVCGAEYSSKNKLFAHIKAEGHAANKTAGPSQTGKKGKARAK